MKAEANIDLQTYLARAPDPNKDRLRFEWHTERYRFAVQQHPSATRIADLGCGLGFGAKILSQLSENIALFDINPNVLAYAEASVGIRGVCAEVYDVHDGPVPQAPYDLICLFEVIEHLEDPTRALKNMRSSLAREGKLVLSTPNFKEGSPGSHPHHAIEYSQRDLEELLRAHFSDVEMYSQGVPENRRLLRHRKTHTWWLRRLSRFSKTSFGRLVPSAMKGRLLSSLTGVSQDSLRSDVKRIRPGLDSEARWSIAVCSE